MCNLLKKSFCVVLTLLITLLLPVTMCAVAAEEQSTKNFPTSSSLTVNEENSLGEGLELSVEQQKEVYDARQEFLYLLGSRQIMYDSYGKIIYTNKIEPSEKVRKSIEVFNDMIEVGIIRFDGENFFCDIEQLLQDSNFIISSEMGLDYSSIVGDNNFSQIEPRAAVCGCNYSQLGLGSMVARNTNDVRGCFFAMAVSSPELALSSAMGYWVGKVRPGGDWDYKVQPNYAPYNRKFCCTYGKNNSKKFYHLSSEFIGNYNYGYTGSILFNLDILKFGSTAAAGFDWTKDSDDYPAITEGYNDAKACGEYLDR